MSKGKNPFKAQWTIVDARAAEKQGWGIFDTGERLEIEVDTENPAGFAEGDDDAAVAWVIQQALRGDKVCAKGLIICMLFDPEWTAADFTTAVESKRITLLAMDKSVMLSYSEVEHRSTSDAMWDDNKVQFIRLIGEMCAAGAIPTGDAMKEMCESMDLTEVEIISIFQRGQNAWDEHLARHKKVTDAKGTKKVQVRVVRVSTVEEEALIDLEVGASSTRDEIENIVHGLNIDGNQWKETDSTTDGLKVTEVTDTKE
jgi:hypothetical protein